MAPASDPGQLVDHLFRQQSGRMVAILTRLFGLHNLELAEDIFQDTLHQALQDWTLAGISDNPGGWLMVVASCEWSSPAAIPICLPKRRSPTR